MIKIRKVNSMPLYNMSPLLKAAEAHGAAVGAFSVSNLEMIRGVMRAAEETETPVILQIAEVRLPHAPLSLIGPAMLAAARQAKVPVAVHLDHGTTFQCIQHGLSLVRYREHPVSPLGFQFTACLFQKIHDGFRRKCCHGAVKEAAIPGNILQDLLLCAVIGHIAAAFAGDQKLFSQPVVAFQKQHASALLCCRNGRKHTGRTTADDDHIISHFVSSRFSYTWY